MSVRKIMLLKGNNRGAVVKLREIINPVVWASAWLSSSAAGYRWVFVSKIYWKPKSL